MHFKMYEKFDIRNEIQNRLLILQLRKKKQSAPNHERFVIAFFFITFSHTYTNAQWTFPHLSSIDLWDVYSCLINVAILLIEFFSLSFLSISFAIPCWNIQSGKTTWTKWKNIETISWPLSSMTARKRRCTFLGEQMPQLFRNLLSQLDGGL